MKRRTILFGAASVSALALAGCAGQTPTQLQSDVTAISQGLSGIVSALKAIPSVPANIVAEAQTAISAIQTNAATIAAALTPQASVVQQIAQAVTTLSTLLTPFFPLSAPVAGVVQAALALVPVILAAVGVQSAGASLSTMTPEQARLVLRAAAAH